MSEHGRGPRALERRSHDVAGSRREELLRLFPEARGEGGALDLERLRLAVGETSAPGRERYGLHWPGRAECFRALQSPSLAALRPCRETSLAFDTTRNLILAGDNLEVLKLLQRGYAGSVRMIYIDPPYNTGHDFIYRDDYAQSTRAYLTYTGQLDAHGRAFGTNPETAGRFHSSWLSMMYPRLYLARTLLREDGAIFVTIDDREVAQLRLLMDEIWGEENFVATIAWQKVTAKKNKALISGSHDHILVYARRLECWSRALLPRSESQTAAFTNPDGDPRGPWRSVSFSVPSEDAVRRADYRYAIELPSGRGLYPPTGRHWNGRPERFAQLRADGRVWFGNDGDGAPRIKTFLSEVQAGIVPDTWWSHEQAGHNQEAKKELLRLFGSAEPYSTPKPTRLVRRMLEIAASDPDSLVLDFFAGSGTTAHAVLDLNRRDGGRRRFILVQLPEPTGRSDYPTIADICVERVRRAALADPEPGESGVPADTSGERQDRGFRVFRLAESGLRPWDPAAAADPDSLARELEQQVERVLPGRTEEDLLFEIALWSGCELTACVEPFVLEGVPVYSVAGGQLLVCLARELSPAVIAALAERKPERVVCLDAAFAGRDALALAAAELFERAGVVSFKTL